MTQDPIEKLIYEALHELDALPAPARGRPARRTAALALGAVAAGAAASVLAAAAPRLEPRSPEAVMGRLALTASNAEPAAEEESWLA
jgi:hypothetical protein